jgi:hypothetical protein
MIRIASALLLRTLATHYGYYLWPDDGSRQWAFYVIGGAANALMAGVIVWVGSEAPGCAGVAVAFAGAWAATEEAQVAACGALQWGQSGAGDLCRRIAGADMGYRLAASLLLAAVITGSIYVRASRRS